ncbi:MAG: hypothetical protein NUW01_06265 [Gemmatimonadaceae bacterium]|nr:hypothetical protein [Gemmatimonadaceae bacterium]
MAAAASIAMLRERLPRTPAIVAPGAGWISNEAIGVLVPQAGPTIYLRVEPRTAALRLGAAAADRPLLAGDPEQKLERLLAEAGRAGQWRALAARARHARTWGDGYGYPVVATGRAECMVDARMAVWDWSPFVPIIAEAGGVFTDWSGGQTSFFAGVIATNGKLAGDVRAILTSSDGEA